MANKETILSARLLQCGKKLTTVSEEKQHFYLVFSHEDERMIAIRTLLFTRICVNNGLNSVKKNHELQSGDCTNIFTKSSGRTKQTKIRSSRRDCYKSSPGQGSVVNKDEL